MLEVRGKVEVVPVL